MNLLPHFQGYMGLVTVLLFFIAVTDVLLNMPQTLRVLRRRDSHGLSASALILGLSNYLLWCLIYIETKSTELLVLNCFTIAVFVALVFSAAWARLKFFPSALPAMAYFFATAAVSCWWPVALPAILMASAVVTFGLSVLEALTASSVSGISLPTWTIVLLNALGYAALGLTDQAPVSLFLWAVVATFAATAMLAIVSLRRRPRKDEPVLV